MKFSVFQLSRRGGRQKNEDRMGYSYTRESALFVLADMLDGAMARERGCRFLREDGLLKAWQGITTVDEVLRVTAV